MKKTCLFAFDGIEIEFDWIMMFNFLQQRVKNSITLLLLSSLFRGITSENNGDVFCWKCFHLFQTKKLQSHEQVCQIHDYCDVKMPKESSEILNYTQSQK